MNTQTQTQIVERLNRIELRLTALELCANSILRVVTTLAAAADKLETKADSIEAKAADTNHRVRKLQHDTNGHKHFTDEQIERCYAIWERAQHNQSVKSNCNRRVSHEVAFNFYSRELKQIGISNVCRFASAIRAYSAKLTAKQDIAHVHGNRAYSK